MVLGFDDLEPCFFLCDGPNPTPEARGPSQGISVSGRGTLTGRWLLTVGVGVGDVGGAHGYSDTGEYFLGQSIHSYWTDHSAWMLAGRRLTPGLAVGVGPSIHYFTTRSGDGRPTTRTGFTLEAETRTSGTWFLTAAVRGHLLAGGAVVHGDEAIRLGEPRTTESWEVLLDTRWS